MKYSKQRELIKNTVLNNPIHPTADEIYSILKPDNINLSLGTVYRNLNLLFKEGIIRKLHIPGQSERFDGILTNHSHIVCEKCKKIIDVECSILEYLNEKIYSEANIKINSYDLILKGVCKNCQ